MPDLGTSTAAPQRHDADQDDARRVTRRRSLPGGRAVVGALLITVAAVGVFAAWLTATAVPTTTYVVAATHLAAGDELADGHLDTVAIDLPDEQAARAFTDPADVAGSVALAPLTTGDLLTRTVVRPPSEVPGRSLFTFELPVARALGGQFEPGDRIDVLGTTDGRTGFVAHDLEVVRGTIDGGAVTVTVAVEEPAVLLTLGNAVDVAQLHLVLADPTTGTDRVVADDPFVDTPPVPAVTGGTATDTSTDDGADDGANGASEAPGASEAASDAATGSG